MSIDTALLHDLKSTPPRQGLVSIIHSESCFSAWGSTSVFGISTFLIRHACLKHHIPLHMHIPVGPSCRYLSIRNSRYGHNQYRVRVTSHPGTRSLEFQPLLFLCLTGYIPPHMHISYRELWP